MTPSQFGTVADAQFRVASTGVGGAQDQALAAAVVQHRVALAIRRALHVHNVSLKGYAERTGNTADRISKILGGHKPMSLTDVAVAYQIFGQSMPAIDTRGWVADATAGHRDKADDLPPEPMWPNEFGEQFRGTAASGGKRRSRPRPS